MTGHDDGPDEPTNETRTATVDESAPRATMSEFSHTNPHTGKTFGQDSAFARGPAVAADGGNEAEPSADAADATADDERDAEEQTMRDVDHEHPDDDAGNANRVFERGADERTDTV